MEKLTQFLYAKPRLFGLLVLLAGIGISIHLAAAYHAGNSVFTKDFMYAPVMLLFGLAALIQPPLILAWAPKNEQPVRPLFKAFSIVIIAIGFGIGLYLEFVVFKDWKPPGFRD